MNLTYRFARPVCATSGATRSSLFVATRPPKGCLTVKSDAPNSIANHVDATRVFFSEYGEDRILANYFSGKKVGFCIEVGANDGLNGSTTFHFERAGWDCLLIEPNPQMCERIRELRLSPVLQVAASNKCGTATLLVAIGSGTAHGLSSIQPEQEAGEAIRSSGYTYEKVEVETKTLDEILTARTQGRSIDFISIDVEGHELEVLEGFNVAFWRPRILVIEDNSYGEKSAVRQHLSKLGYEPFHRTVVNDWYAHQSDAELINARSKIRYKVQLWMWSRVWPLRRIAATVPGARKLRSLWVKLRGRRWLA